jgi:glycerate dehydrogenase
MIALMKKDVIIVNTARGAVTDEAELARAVKEGRIGALGSDVYSVEPFGEDHPFNAIKELPNVCLTPHMAWGAYEARERCLGDIIKNIKAFYSGEIRSRVDLK